MKNQFNIEKYIFQLGEELVAEFSKASLSTHPVAIGHARESSVSKKLKNILPNNIGIGSGFVIDSFGNVSSQCDIIIYEENLALKWIINDDEEYAYYNCESVIAIGEVKSKASIEEIRDGIIKMKNVKNLKRFCDNGYAFRHYFSSVTGIDSLTEKKPYDNSKNSREQIFTFIIAKEISASTNSVAKELSKICGANYEYVNRIISLDGNYFTYCKIDNGNISLVKGKPEATHLVRIKNSDKVFNNFICELSSIIIYNRTVPLNYNKYLKEAFYIEDIVETIELTNVD